MKLTMKLLVLFFGVLLANVANAESPREQLKQMVEQLQGDPNDGEMREKIIKLARSLKPAPGISEEARRSFITGESLFKQSTSLSSTYNAANSFWKAATLAPWWSDAYWNAAIAYQAVGQYGSAKAVLELYLLTNLSAADQRAAKDRLYAIDAEKEVASTTPLHSGLTGYWQRSRHQDLSTGKVFEHDTESVVFQSVYEIRQDGSSYKIICMECDSEWTITTTSSSNDAITFQSRLVSRTSGYDSGIMNHECKLAGRTLDCMRIDKDGEKVFSSFIKRGFCEIYGESPGLAGYHVICK